MACALHRLAVRAVCLIVRPGHSICRGQAAFLASADGCVVRNLLTVLDFSESHDRRLAVAWLTANLIAWATASRSPKARLKLKAEIEPAQPSASTSHFSEEQTRRTEEL